MCKNDYDNWQPTPENINALPKSLRDFIHEMAANCASELIMENFALKSNIEGLKAMIKENNANMSQT